jgi:hypothetical protein
MEQWEHMCLATDRRDWDGAMAFFQTRGPSYQRWSINVEQGFAGDPFMRQLDELGREGWHLVQIETEHASNHTYRTYWLRRRVQ